MSVDAQPTAGGVPRGLTRLALGALLALVLVSAALVAAFLLGVPIPGDWVRAPLERALTAAFGVPTRLEGPLHVRTGLVAAVSADALVLADPLDPAGAPLARATKPSARIDLAALVHRAVALEEVKGERMELKLARSGDGRANWAPIFASSPGSGPAPVTFAGISRLHVGAVRGTYRGPGGADPALLEIGGLDATLEGSDPITARGTARFAGQAVAFDLRTASLVALGTSAPIPVQGTLKWSGASIGLDGAAASDASSFDAALEVTAPDADPLLAALGIPVRAAGALDARGRLRVTATDAAVAGLALKLGASDVSGSGRIAWGAERTALALDLAAARVDLRPFLAAERPEPGVNPFETAIEALERLVAGVDADVRVTAAEVDRLVTTLREFSAEARATKDAVTVRAGGVLAGTRVRSTFDFDARKVRRALAAQLEGGSLSTGALPREARPAAVSGTAGGIRGRLRAQGASPREILGSAQASIEARDVRWTFDERGKHPVKGRFDALRLSVQGAGATSAEVAGRLGDDPCRAKVSGGALAPLLEGERWPLRVAASCLASRLDAQGQVTVGAEHVAAELGFDASAARIGPLMQAFGIPPDAPHPAAARGTLVVEPNVVRVKLDALRLGRTAGAGTVVAPLDGKGAPRVQLALTDADVGELATLAPAGGPAPRDPLELEVLPAKLHLPGIDFDLAADAVQVAGETLQRVRTSGRLVDGHLPPTRFAFAWRGAQVAGDFGADLRGAAPSVRLDATAQNADLGAVLARLGQTGIGLRAGTVSVRASAAGVRLGGLLSSAHLDAALERGRLDLAHRPAQGLPGRAEFGATLKAAPGQPAALAARGTFGGEPFELSLDTPTLVGLARQPVPATLGLTLGDARLQASGNVARDGTGDAKVKLTGERVDRLGKLAGVTLPQVGPYGAAGTIVVSADSIRASDVDVSFGKSRVLGELQLQARRGGRPLHTAVLRAPMLHLEDIGGARWLRDPLAPKASAEREAAAAKEDEAELARVFELLRASDLDAAVEIDAIHGGGERFASGRLKVTLDAGVLRLLVQDVRTASGTVDADLRVDASGAQPKLGVRVRATELEFGPLARTVDPATKLGGRLDLLTDLTAQGPPGKLLPALSGKVDAAAYPRELRSEALDFWGTGLLSSMLRTLDPSAQSQVECAVTSLDIDAGVARTRAFFVDSTLVRIIGQIDVDLVTRGVSGRLRPQSVRPELLTVAPTMVLGGTIDEPRVSVAPETIFLAPLRFATPLAGYARDFLSARGELRDGVAGCRMAFDRARETHSAGADSPGGGR